MVKLIPWIGDYMSTIKDIAKKLNLGVSTVSMAINNNPKIKEETRKLVHETARELGYVKNGLAADLQQGRSNLILLVVEDAARPFFANVIDIVQRQLNKYDFDLLISTTYKNHTSTAKKYISEHRAAGAIVFTMSIDNNYITQYASSDFPVFVLGRHIIGDHTYCLTHFFEELGIKYKPPGYLATDYLNKRGFENIAFVFGALHTLGTVRKLEG